MDTRLLPRRRDAKPRPKQTLLAYDRHGDVVDLEVEIDDAAGATVVPLFARNHIARSARS